MFQWRVLKAAKAAVQQASTILKLLYSIFMSIDTSMTSPNSHLFQVAFN